MTLAVLTIGGIAAQGDGVAEDADGQVFVPLTVPGDIVEAEIAPAAGGTRRGEAVAWLTRGPDRVEPPCRHFGQCGACALQHLAAPALATWKRERIVAALRQRGFADPPVAATLTTAAASRRRAGLGAIRTADGVQLGFSMRAGRRIVDMAECHILAPPLAALVAPLRGWLATMLRLRETAFRDPGSYFAKYAALSHDEAVAEASRIWDTINGPNLVQNILPTRSRATLVLRKDRDHSVRYVRLRKL